MADRVDEKTLEDRFVAAFPAIAFTIVVLATVATYFILS